MRIEMHGGKLHVRRGDKVRLLSGDDKGKEGVVLKVFPKKCRALVENVNIVSCHTKPTAKNPNGGGIVKREAPVHVSKLMLLDPSDDKPTRIGRKLNDAGKLVRYSKRTGKVL